MAKAKAIVDHLHEYDYNALEGARIIARSLRDKVRSADSLQELLETHKLAAQLGILNKNIDSDMYGMFRTDDVSKMKGSEVYIHDLVDDWTYTLDSVEEMKNEDHNVYVRVRDRYKQQLESNFKEIEGHINHAKDDAYDEAHNRNIIQRLFSRRSYPKAKDLIGNDFVKNYIKDAGITELSRDGEAFPADEITSETLSSKIIPVRPAGDSLKEKMEKAGIVHAFLGDPFHKHLPLVQHDGKSFAPSEISLRGKDVKVRFSEYTNNDRKQSFDVMLNRDGEPLMVTGGTAGSKSPTAKELQGTRDWRELTSGLQYELDYILKTEPEQVRKEEKKKEMKEEKKETSVKETQKEVKATGLEPIASPDYPRIDGYNPAQDKLQEIFDKVASESKDLRLANGKVHGLNAVMLQTLGEAAKTFAFTKDEICDFVDSISIKYNGNTDMERHYLYQEAARNFNDLPGKSVTYDEIRVNDKKEDQIESKAVDYINDPESYLKGREPQIVEHIPSGKTFLAYKIETDTVINKLFGKELVPEGGYILQEPDSPKLISVVDKRAIDCAYRFIDKKEETMKHKDVPGKSVTSDEIKDGIKPSPAPVQEKTSGTLNIMPTSDGKISILKPSGEWLKVDRISEMSEGFHVVKKDGKFNYMNKDGELLAKNWLDSASMFKDGVAKIRLGNARMEINKEGTILKKTVEVSQEVNKGMKI